MNSFGYFVFMVFLVEIFETKNRMIGVAISQCSNFFIFPLWIHVKGILLDNTLNPIHALVPFAICALICTFFLKETLNLELS